MPDQINIQTIAAKRLLQVLATLLGVSLLTFILLELVPGDAAELLLSQQQTAGAERLAALRHGLGLDGPLLLRYLRWLGRAVLLDFGSSFRSGEPVSHELLRCLPITLILACTTFCLVVSMAIAGGLVAALWQNRLPDKAHRLWTVLMLSVPDYWLGLLLLLLFALKLHWLPVTGNSSNLQTFILPTIALGLSVAAAEGRILRASIIEVLQQNWVLFARAKGLRPMQIVLHHVLKPAMLPLLSLWGMLLGHLLGGAVVVESVFSLPGLGKLAADAVLQRDMPLLQGIVLLMTCFFLISSWLMDLAAASIRPMPSKISPEEKM